MVAFGRLAFTRRLFLGVIIAIYLVFTFLLPDGEEPDTTLKHLQEDNSVQPEGCDGKADCQNVNTGKEKEEHARLKEENAKLMEENVKLKEVPAAEQAKPWISANTDVRLWIGTCFCFSFRFDRVHTN